MSKKLFILALVIFLLPSISAQAISKKQNTAQRNQNKWNLCQRKTSEMSLIANAFAQAGANSDQIAVAQKVACFESNMDCQITSKRNRKGNVNVGLFQINSVHKQQNMNTCEANINFAVNLSKGGKNWKLWSAYKKALTLK